VRRADFDDEASLVAAFTGADRALLISTDALDRPGRRLAQHQRALRALVAAGVKQVAYTSLAGAPTSTHPIAPDHVGTEAAIIASGLDYTLLRNNLYAELLLGSLAGAIASGQLVNAIPTGAIAYVSRDDCARAAAAAVATRRSGHHIVDVTGPDAVTSADLVAVVTALVGRPITHIPVPIPALVDGLIQHGFPPPVAELFAAFDTSAERGELNRVTDHLARLTGTPGRSVASFLAANRAALGA
jgi:NAD(P)H dehydrogenase (quinone)